MKISVSKWVLVELEIDEDEVPAEVYGSDDSPHVAWAGSDFLAYVHKDDLEKMADKPEIKNASVYYPEIA